MRRAVGAEEAEHLAALDAYAQVAHGQLAWLGLGLGLGLGLVDQQLTHEVAARRVEVERLQQCDV